MHSPNVSVRCISYAFHLQFASEYSVNSDYLIVLCSNLYIKSDMEREEEMVNIYNLIMYTTYSPVSIIGHKS